MITTFEEIEDMLLKEGMGGKQAEVGAKGYAFLVKNGYVNLEKMKASHENFKPIVSHVRSDLESRHAALEKAAKIEGMEKYEMSRQIFAESSAEKQMMAESMKDGRAIDFWRFIDHETNNNLFTPGGDPQEGIGLTTRNLQCMAVIGLILPSEKVAAYVGEEKCLFLNSIVSLKKGNGYKMMCKFINLSNKSGMTLWLWSETEKNVKYFERYGFKNHGSIGDFGEYLMVYGSR